MRSISCDPRDYFRPNEYKVVKECFKVFHINLMMENNSGTLVKHKLIPPAWITSTVGCRKILLIATTSGSICDLRNPLFHTMTESLLKVPSGSLKACMRLFEPRNKYMNAQQDAFWILPKQVNEALYIYKNNLISIFLVVLQHPWIDIRHWLPLQCQCGRNVC